MTLEIKIEMKNRYTNRYKLIDRWIYRSTPKDLGKYMFIKIL